MDRTITIGMPSPVPQGHRVRVHERVADGEARTVIAVTDLETGSRWQREASAADDAVWTGTVRDCVIEQTTGGVRTLLHVDIVPGAATEADDALRGADAAAEAARTEALRWGGADRVPEPEQPRFW